MVRKYIEAQSITEMVKAARQINDLAPILPTLLNKCGRLEGVEEDTERFNNWLSIFDSDYGSYRVMTQNINTYYDNIASDVSAFMESLNQDNWVAAGSAYADILNLVIGSFPSLHQFVL